MRSLLRLALLAGVAGAIGPGCARDRDADGFTEAVDCDDADASVGLGELWFRDGDGDGWGDDQLWLQACSAPDGYCDRAGDCADTDSATHPEAAERWYDGWDQDCDGASDYDQDGDGYDSLDYGGEDCDDTDPSVHPGVYDAPWDGVDADCSGGSDSDHDGDGYDAEQVGGDDCDDLDPDVNPDAVEQWYDGVDQDCSGGSDHDQDGDGYDSDAEVGGGDCDDTDADVFPGAAEQWYDGVDQDCDGGSDYDQDGDGYDALDYGGTDCQDGDAAIHPGAFEWNDGDDNDCDGNNDVRYTDSAEWALAGEGAADGAGSAVAAAGDVDGDGLQDLLVGAPSWQDDSGAAYLILGASASTAAGATSLWYADARIAGEDGELFGSALAALGDVDGDGYADLVVGAPGAAGGTGAAYLLVGPLAGDLGTEAAQAAVGPSDPAAELGRAVGGGADLDGDGGIDMVLGAPGDDDERGAVLLLDATSAGTLGESDAFARVEGAEVGDRAGAAVAQVGDIDGDGLDELLIGAPGQSGRGSDAGAAYLFRGPLAGIVHMGSADVTMMAEAAGDSAGAAVAAAGDTDGDGYADLLVGAPHSDNRASEGGTAYLVTGPITDSAMELTSALATFGGDIEGIQAGTAVAGGDVDGDGVDDILVGAPTADLAASDNGVAYLVLGPLAGSLCSCGSDAKFYGDDDDHRAGAAVALPGDATGDGFGDVLIGAPGAADGAGGVYLLWGAER